MKTKKAFKKALKHILCCILLLIIFVLTITFKVDAKSNYVYINESLDNNEISLKSQLDPKYASLNKYKESEVNITIYNTPHVIEKDINYYIEENIKVLNFYSNVFGFDIDFIKNNLIERSELVEEINENNIASLKSDDGSIKKFSNINYGIVEYFYYLEEHYPLERKAKGVSYTGNSDYIEKLIMYYTSIYTNVDTSTALSIGAAESGFYKAKYMLSINNIYGGMSSKGLIKYSNIEYGVLTYIRYLSKNYYSKGLTTLESIGKVYCPTYNDNGYKVASSHWISLVNNAKTKYNNYTQNILIDDIINY